MISNITLELAEFRAALREGVHASFLGNAGIPTCGHSGLAVDVVQVAM